MEDCTISCDLWERLLYGSTLCIIQLLHLCHVCQLSNATQSQSPDDFNELQGVAYFDENLETPQHSAPDIVQFSSCLKL